MIRWGIMATGKIAHKFIETMGGLGEETMVLACASREKTRAEEFAQTYGIPRAYGSYEELVNDSEIDVIYICTPNHLHYENMKLCINAGKAVLCEKPFTLNEIQAKEIFCLAKEKKVFVMEAFWIKMLPLYKKLHELLEEKCIGELQHIRADYGFIAEGNRRKRKLELELGGGALLDIGIYNIGFACMIFGYEPTKIMSNVRKSEFGTDEFETIIFEYANKKTATLTSTIGMNMPTQGVIYGTKGMIRFPNYQQAEKLYIHRNDGADQMIELPFEINGFEYQVREVQKCLEEGQITSTIQTPEQTIAVLKIMDYLRKQWNIKFVGEES